MKPVQIVAPTEDFRQSQIATLSWSGICLLAGLGSTIGQNVTFPWTTITFPAEPLMLFLWFASLFYFLRWFWFWRVVHRLNKHEDLQRRAGWQSVFTDLDKIREKVATSVSLAHEAEQNAITINELMLEFENLAQSEAQNIHQGEYGSSDMAGDFRSQAQFHLGEQYAANVDAGRPALAGMQNLIEDTAKKIDGVISQHQQQIIRAVERIRSQRARIGNPVEVQRKIDLVNYEVTKLVDSFAKFKTILDWKVRAIFTVLDVIPPIILFVCASLSTATHFGLPRPEYFSPRMPDQKTTSSEAGISRSRLATPAP